MAIEYTKERDDLRSEQYNKLAQKYHELEALLERWNEIAPDLFDIRGIIKNQYKTPKLIRLIQDTSEAIK